MKLWMLLESIKLFELWYPQKSKTIIYCRISQTYIPEHWQPYIWISNKNATQMYLISAFKEKLKSRSCSYDPRWWSRLANRQSSQLGWLCSLCEPKNGISFINTRLLSTSKFFSSADVQQFSINKLAVHSVNPNQFNFCNRKTNYQIFKSKKIFSTKAKLKKPSIL